ncbi:cupin domain-containing protein [Pueribacillus sp. YX66]|uniref:cupin domain-containing protein n=1 Tax=Pueribacillus sp. YX66 TaxID=3229242 RepID=UPI00358D2D05
MKKSVLEAPFNEKSFSMHHLFKSDSEKVFVVSLKPNQTLPSHKHPEHNLYVLGYEGEAEFVINGVTHSCKQGDVFYLEPDDEFGIENNSDGNFRVYCVMSKRS